MYISGGRFHRRILHTPKSQRVRPSSGKLRQALFNSIQHEVEGSCVLDLFAGVGSIGLEALSRGARRAIFVEKDPVHVSFLKKNIASLGCEDQAEVFRMDVRRFLESTQQRQLCFDLIFADPPYGLFLHDRLYALEVLEWIDQNNMLHTSGKCFIEEGESLSPRLLHLEPLFIRKYAKAYLHGFRHK